MSLHSFISFFLPTHLDNLVDLLFFSVIPHTFSPLFSPGISRSGFYRVLIGILLLFLFVITYHPLTLMHRWVRIMHSTGEYVCRAFLYL